MTRTSERPDVDLAEVVPGIDVYASPAVRLHPRPGQPEAWVSHIGGPLLWPAADPWPRCDARFCWHYLSDGPAGTSSVQPSRVSGLSVDERTDRLRASCDVPLTPLVQLYRADFPEIAFPAGSDVLQLLWRGGFWDRDCIRAYWRDSASVFAVQAAPPVDVQVAVRPCVLDPERIIDFPWFEELPGDVLRRINDALGESAAEEGRPAAPALYHRLSAAPGFKVGGSLAWPAVEMPSVICPDCGASCTLLVQLDTYEWLPSDPDSPWRPSACGDVAEDTEEYENACSPVGLVVGRATYGGVFACSADSAHAVQFRCQ
ncbi:hypothetical protein ACFROC_07545 [Nocardia tengchongensis]|uniref:hypothetical protein n=1 Tax=Nocardia tengchongensis TaxID=2055889 RepID=UPI00369DD750